MHKISCSAIFELRKVKKKIKKILARSTNGGENTSSIEFYQDLQKVIEEMDLVKMEIKEKVVVQDQLRIVKSVTTGAVGLSGSTSVAQKITMAFNFEFKRICELFCELFLHCTIEILCVASTTTETAAQDSNLDNDDKDGFGVVKFPLHAHDISKELIMPFVMREKEFSNKEDEVDHSKMMDERDEDDEYDESKQQRL
ncbi:hypothetical protein AAHA92_26929 [Salvia divinorum]|uniref:Uncharacterized protein n=1 Tax=Salvia divinorum TaxID=28513 RepID=A0ABD1G234_SALDI